MDTELDWQKPSARLLVKQNHTTDKSFLEYLVTLPQPFFLKWAKIFYFEMSQVAHSVALYRVINFMLHLRLLWIKSQI